MKALERWWNFSQECKTGVKTLMVMVNDGQYVVNDDS